MGIAFLSKLRGLLTCVSAMQEQGTTWKILSYRHVNVLIVGVCAMPKAMASQKHIGKSFWLHYRF